MVRILVWAYVFVRFLVRGHILILLQDPVLEQVMVPVNLQVQFLAHGMVRVLFLEG